jgi:hypothetical protein
MLEEFVDESNQLPGWIIERRFVTRTLLERLKIKGLTFTSGPYVHNESITGRKFDILLYFWSVGSDSVDLSTLVLAAVKRNDYDTVVDILNTVEQEHEEALIRGETFVEEDGRAVKVDQQQPKLTVDYRALIASFENDNPDMVRFLLSRKLINLNDINIWHYITENKSWVYYKMLIEFGATPPLSSIL